MFEILTICILYYWGEVTSYQQVGCIQSSQTVKQSNLSGDFFSLFSLLVLNGTTHLVGQYLGLLSIFALFGVYQSLVAVVQSIL